MGAEKENDKEYKAEIITGSKKKSKMRVREHAAFGMWKDRKDMADVRKFVRDMRKREFNA